MALTIRERAVECLVLALESMQDGFPTTDPYSVTWEIVARQELGVLGERKKYALAVIEGLERKEPKISQMECFLPVALEFRMILEPDDNPSVEGNRVLGDIQRKVREDIHLQGLTLNLVETENELDIEDAQDRQIGGTVMIEIHYRHAENDPRKLV